MGGDSEEGNQTNDKENLNNNYNEKKEFKLIKVDKYLDNKKM